MKHLIKKSEKIFNVGDVVIFKTHPYNDITPYVVKEVLQDGRYFIENDEHAYTGVHGINLELVN